MLTILRIPCFLSGCGISFMTMSICFIVLKDLCDNLNDLQKMQIKKLGISKHGNQNWLLKIEMCYRRYQVFAIIINESFRIHFWPIFQFEGASVCIALSFTLLVYGKLLTLSVKMIMLLLLMISLVFNCFLLDFGSKSLLLSRKILAREKTGVECGQRKLLRKFVKRCSPIVLRVGSIHKMDR